MSAVLVHLRTVVPTDRVGALLDALHGNPAVSTVIHLPGAATKPVADVVLCDVAREAAHDVLELLHDLRIPDDGSVSMDEVGTTVSARAERASRDAAGAAADAIVWEHVAAKTGADVELSVTFVAFMVIATLIGACGIVTDSPILIVGAMVVGPEYGPLAGVSVALVRRERPALLASLRALGVGFPVAIAGAVVAGLLLDAADLVEVFDPDDRPLTGFISQPDEFTVIVALLGGVAGMLSLTSGRSTVLMGVLISVTTIPAAADVGLGIALEEWDEAGGAAVQLVVNIAAIVLTGVATLVALQYLNRRG